MISVDLNPRFAEVDTWEGYPGAYLDPVQRLIYGFKMWPKQHSPISLSTGKTCN